MWESYDPGLAFEHILKSSGNLLLGTLHRAKLSVFFLNCADYIADYSAK